LLFPFGRKAGANNVSMRKSAQSPAMFVNTALEAKVRATPGRGLDIVTIDSDRRRAKEPDALGILFGLNSNGLDGRPVFEPGLRDYLTNLLDRLLPGRATIEVEDLDRLHLFTSTKLGSHPIFPMALT
jgi:hypothetical protein